MTLPPEPPGSPARTNHAAACHQRGSTYASPRTTFSPTPKALLAITGVRQFRRMEKRFADVI